MSRILTLHRERYTFVLKAGADLMGLFLSLDTDVENPVTNVGTQGEVLAEQARTKLLLDARLNLRTLDQTFLNTTIVTSDRFSL